jgi:hypothetical protein
MMESLKVFFLVLFFSKTILLTPNPITIYEGATQLDLIEPISAITEGAGLFIDVDSMLAMKERSNIIKTRNKIGELFPEGFITVTLSNASGDIQILRYDGSAMVNRDKAYLGLYGKVPLDTEWTSITINSKMELRDISIIWKNHKK